MTPELSSEVVQRRNERLDEISRVVGHTLLRRNAVLWDVAEAHALRTEFDMTTCLAAMIQAQAEAKQDLINRMIERGRP